ncbi:MAG: tRNA(Met) cytidine acetyltransferase TmcA [Salinirussus sp.]
MRTAVRLVREARRTSERRLLVLAGEAGTTRDRAVDALEAAGLGEAVYVGAGEFPRDQLPADRADELLGTTWEAVVVDCHDACRPNALGRASGAVDGGGLLVLLVPPLDVWPDRRDEFDASLAVPPFDTGDVTGRFRRRLVATLRAHPGIAIVDVDTGTVERDGRTDPAPRRREPRSDPSPGAGDGEECEFPDAVYAACLTADQARAVAAFEGLHARTAGGVLIVEADRGRGKSSAAGLAAAGHAVAGRDVLVTAPAYRNAREVFRRGSAVLGELGVGVTTDDPDGDGPRDLRVGDGRIRFEPPGEAVDIADDADLVIADEAAALPVRRLEQFLGADAVAYTTTVRGYEGAGRGFAVRFRDRLAASEREVTEVRLTEPIRHAPADPVEVWTFRALALDARPPVAPVVAGADPDSASYRRLPAAELAADDRLLREVFGLLVSAHYRTEPADLARLLDAPNVSVRALLSGDEGRDHPVSVALLAREGGLSTESRSRAYEGGRLRGNMIPDVLTSQLRDERAGRAAGRRVLRIATHEAVRSRGLGSHLLSRIREDAGPDTDYLGVGYGATPELVSFWLDNGFGAVHLATTRNDASGEYSAIMLDPLTPAGEDLYERHAAWFRRRLPGTLADPLADADPGVVRAVLRAVDGVPELDLSPAEWRVAAGASTGAAIHDTAPRPFRRLVFRHFVGGAPDTALDDRAERLLVRKCLQTQPWEQVAGALAFDSPTACKRTFGDAAGVLVDLYGGDVAETERERLG